MCDDVEDEFHFLLVCPLYTDIRIKYIKRYYRTRVSMFKFLELMKTENKTMLKNLSLYVTKATEKRLTALKTLYN